MRAVPVLDAACADLAARAEDRKALVEQVRVRRARACTKCDTLWLLQLYARKQDVTVVSNCSAAVMDAVAQACAQQGGSDTRRQFLRS